MKVEADKLLKQMARLPDEGRTRLVGAIRLNTEEGARVARTLAPDVTGETRANITTEYREGGLVGMVVVIDSQAPRAEKDRAYAIEHGRKQGDRGTTEGVHFVWNTRQYLAKKFQGRIRRALNKAIRGA